MKAQEIQETIKRYDALYAHAEKVIGKLCLLDSKMYNIARGIEEITFDEEYVGVECDDSCCGDRDTHYFEFPISFLSMSDEELAKAVVTEKERRIEQERIRAEKVEMERKLKIEQQEKLQYERLKKKFENS